MSVKFDLTSWVTSICFNERIHSFLQIVFTREVNQKLRDQKDAIQAAHEAVSRVDKCFSKFKGLQNKTKHFYTVFTHMKNINDITGEIKQ